MYKNKISDRIVEEVGVLGVVLVYFGLFCDFYVYEVIRLDIFVYS